MSEDKTGGLGMTICGYYLMRLRPHGPLRPARIWDSGEQDEFGSTLLKAEVAGLARPVFDSYARHRVWVNIAEETAEQPGFSELVDCRGCRICETDGLSVVTTAVWPGPGFVLRRGLYPKCLRNQTDEETYTALMDLIDNKNWIKELKQKTGE